MAASSSNGNHPGKRTPERSKARVCCMCCTTRPRTTTTSSSSDDDADNSGEADEGRAGQPHAGVGVKRTAADADKDNTLRYGLTGLSQLSDLPRYCSSDSDTTANVADSDNDHSTVRQKKKCGWCWGVSCCCGCCCRERKASECGSSPPTGRMRRCTTCCKKVTAFLFSHVGLSLVVMAYAVLGAFIFMSLEAPYEKNERTRMAEVRRTSVELLWNITFNMNIFYKPNWTAEAEAVFLDFQDKMYTAVKWEGWDGQDVTVEAKWSFFGALLYSITVITTIGYGHITPKTPYGRLATIGYALVGIPLTLLWLANMGTLFGDCFRFLYKHLCYGLMWLCCPSQLSGSRSRLRQKTKHQPLVPASKAGLAAEGRDGTGKGSAPLNSAEEGEVTYVSSELAQDTEVQVYREKKVRVPMLVSLLVIALYILLGAVLFSIWETDWDYLIGAYFCFITLSTIGFGDFVPGFGTVWSKEKAIFNACYLIFGLALIAMCFNLMQEEVRAKCSWLARKLRLIDRSCVQNVNNNYASAAVAASKGCVVDADAQPPGTVLQGVRSPHQKSRDRSPLSVGRNVYPREFLSVQMETEGVSRTDNSSRSTPTVMLVRGGSGGADGHYGGSVSSGSGLGGGGGLGAGGVGAGSSSSLGSKSLVVTLVRNASGQNVNNANGCHASCNSLSYSGSSGSGAQQPRSGASMAGGERGARTGVALGNGPVQPNGTFPGSGKAVPTSLVARSQADSCRLLNNLAENESGDEEDPVVSVATTPRRPVSVAPSDIADGLVCLDLDLGVCVDEPSSPLSPKMRRRDRSRSPVRGRSRMRQDASGSGTGGGTRKSVGEEDAVYNDDDDDDDDDDTLDACSTASSTDLVKVANALRRERQTAPPSPADSPTTVTSEDTLPTDQSHHLHHDNSSNSSMVTFRPTHTPAHISACALIPTTSRPPSRCQSRARSTSPVLRTFYQQGYDVLGAASKPTGGAAAEAEENQEEGSAATEEEQRSRSAFTKPRPNSSVGQRVPQQQLLPHVQPKRPQLSDNKPALRCVSPMLKATRSVTPAVLESPVSLSSSASAEFQRPPPILPKPKNRLPRGATSKPPL